MSITYRVVKLVNQENYIALCQAPTLALMRNKHYFLATQHLVVKQSTVDACIPLYAKYKIIDIKVLIFYHFSRTKNLYLKGTVGRIFGTKVEFTFLYAFGVHFYMLYTYSQSVN